MSLVQRGGPRLTPDASRVLLRPFVPGSELVFAGVSRAQAVVDRVLKLSDAEVEQELKDVASRLNAPHGGVNALFARHAQLLPHGLEEIRQLTGQRAELAGAFLTQEYAIEAAAILNPSLVEHPDQSGLADGQVRIIMTLRAIGEGHISSLEFRTGVIDRDGSVTLDEPTTQLTRGTVSGGSMSVEHLRNALEFPSAAVVLEPVLSALPDPFTSEDLDDVLEALDTAGARRVLEESPLDRLRRVAQSSYRLEFEAESELSERVLFPNSDDERNGIEDVRFLRYVDEDGSVEYRATYTAYSGTAISPHLLRTEDFRTFSVGKLVGPAAVDKGMALFPRPINGQQWSLARFGRESLGLATSSDGLSWQQESLLKHPRHPWELIQLGTCAPPIETSRGWLVITHGVGPVRRYSLGALMLDLNDPTKLIGDLADPLLVPDAEESIGYVPNVVYTCGALVHEGTLVLPYGCSDSSIRFATAKVDELVDRILAG